jgi:tetratricopeptide (TPR) repeat protein
MLLLHDRDAALKHVDAGLEASPDSKAFYLRRAQIHCLIGDYEASLQDVDRALEMDPKCLTAICERAIARLRIAQRTAEPDLARERLEQALADFVHLQEKTPVMGISRQFRFCRRLG